MSKPVKKAPAVPPAERDEMVRVAAYYLYEKQGYEGGRELDHWVAAEAQVDAMLSPAESSAMPTEATRAAATPEPAAAPKAPKKTAARKAAAAGEAGAKTASKKAAKTSGATGAAPQAAKRTRATKA